MDDEAGLTTVQLDMEERDGAGVFGEALPCRAAILFLCSDAASFVYGAALDVDGGSMFR